MRPLLKAEDIQVGKTYAFPRQNSRGISNFVTVRQIDRDFKDPILTLRGEWGPNPPDCCVTLSTIGMAEFLDKAVCEATDEILKARGIAHPGFKFIGGTKDDPYCNPQ